MKRLLGILVAGTLAIAMGSQASPPSPAPTIADDFPDAECAGLRSRLLSYFERAGRVWDPDPWTYELEDSNSWRRATLPALRSELRFHTPFLDLSPPAKSFTETQECSLLVWNKFFVDHDTVAFTMGRAPEECSEAPRMIWRDSRRKQWRRAVPPLFNWNVEALWCTEHYLIFGLVADYEYGAHDERLAFWHLKEGGIVLSPSLVFDKSGSMFNHAPAWPDARLAETEKGIVFTKRDSTFAFWPDRRTYASAYR